MSNAALGDRRYKSRTFNEEIPVQIELCLHAFPRPGLHDRWNRNHQAKSDD
jgi:hypothetical protein